MNKEIKRGFSLLELMYSILIFAIIITAAIPALQTFTLKHALTERVNRIKAAINFSRNLSIKDNSPLVLSPLHSHDWSRGMHLFIDDSNKQQLMDKKDILKIWHWDEDKFTVKWKGFRSNHYLQFSPDISKSLISGRFIISANNNLKIRRVLVVNRLGRVRVEDET